MSTKEILYREIENASPHALEEVLSYLQWLNSKKNGKGATLDKIAQHVGILNDTDAQELKNLINNSFEKIEGEWK